MAQRAEGSHKGSNAKSVSKTLEILSTFNELAPEQRTSDIANKLHMNISTVSRHLNTMLDWNFLERDDSTGYYSLGLEIVALAGAALQNNDVYRHAYPELQQLSYKYGVHSHMGVPRAVDVVHLISICCESTMELLIPMGHCHPMYCSAMGRAMLAYMSQAEVQKVLRASELQKLTPETKIDLREINQELIHTRSFLMSWPRAKVLWLRLSLTATGIQLLPSASLPAPKASVSPNGRGSWPKRS